MVNTLKISNLDEFLEEARKHSLREDLLEKVEYSLTLLSSHPDKRSRLGQDLLEHTLGTVDFVFRNNLGLDCVLGTVCYSLAYFCGYSLDKVRSEFGPKAHELSAGLVKLSNMRDRTNNFFNSGLSDQERSDQSEQLRKMLIAVVADIRIVIIHLAWHTQSMQYLTDVTDLDLQRSMARDTLDIYAPLANRLGLWQIKWVLEDLALRFLQPQHYHRIARLLDEKRDERLKYIEEVKSVLGKMLSDAGIKCQISGRAKHIYSIWKKMSKKNVDFADLYDINALRVLVDSVSDCYEVVRIVHDLWTPISAEFDDYIAMPKKNKYQSIHTCVVALDGKSVEVQVRTHQMHEEAENGIAAHWRYKEGGKSDEKYESMISWIRQLIDLGSWSDLVSEFKLSLFWDRVYVLTPMGKVISLAKGSTAIDFAYSLHTSIGHRCRGVKVNNRISQLGAELKSGQMVEIITGKHESPSINWIHNGWAKSPRTISKIRSWFKRQNSLRVEDEGRNILEAFLKSRKLKKSDKLYSALGFSCVNSFYRALGSGELTLSSLHTLLVDDVKEVKLDSSRRSDFSFQVLVAGVDNMMTLLARCCKPVPPDKISGFITRGRGITVHRENCSILNGLCLQSPERLISVDWGSRCSAHFPVDVELCVSAENIFDEVKDFLVKQKIPITSIQSNDLSDAVLLFLTLEVSDIDKLRSVLIRLGRLDGVIYARRI